MSSIPKHLYETWPQDLVVILQTHYEFIPNVSTTVIQPHITSSNGFNSNVFKKMHDVGFALCNVGNGNVFACACIDSEGGEGVIVRKRAGLTPTPIADLPDGTAVYIPLKGFFSVSSGTLMQQPTWLKNLGGRVGAAAGMVKDAVKSYMQPPQSAGPDDKFGFALASQMCDGDETSCRTSQAYARHVLHNFHPMMTKFPQAASDIRANFSRIFSGAHVFQPGSVCLENADKLIRWLQSNGHSDAAAFLQQPPSVAVVNVQNKTPSTLASIIGQVAIKSESINSYEIQHVSKSAQKAGLVPELELGMRVICSHNRMDKVAANSTGTVVMASPLHILWDKGGVLELVTERATEIIPVHPNIVTAGNQIVSVASVSVSDWEELLTSPDNIDTQLAVQTAFSARGAYNFSEEAWRQTMTTLPSAQNYAWGMMGKEANIKHTKYVNTVGRLLENDPLADHKVLILRSRSMVPSGSFAFEMSKWQADRPKEASVVAGGTETIGNDLAFKGLDATTIKILDENFVLFRGISPPVSALPLQQELAFYQSLWGDAVNLGRKTIALAKQNPKTAMALALMGAVPLVGAGTVLSAAGTAAGALSSGVSGAVGALGSVGGSLGTLGSTLASGAVTTGSSLLSGTAALGSTIGLKGAALGAAGYLASRKDVRDTVSDQITNAVSDDDAYVGARDEISTCNRIDENDPATYRFLSMQCCTRTHGLKYARPSLTRAWEDSGCYHPQFDSLQDDGIFRDGIKLTKGKQIPEPVILQGNLVDQTSPIDDLFDGAVLKPAAMASVALSLIEIKNSGRFSGVRSDGRLITTPIPPPEQWVKTKGLYTLIRRSDLQIEADGYDQLQSATRRYSIINGVSAPDWPLVIPVPEFKNEIGALQSIAEGWKDVIAFHTDGFLYLKHAQTPGGFNPHKLPSSGNPDQRLFVDAEYIRKGADGPETAPLAYSPELIQFVFFPGVQVPDTIPSQTSPVEAVCPYTTLAGSLDPRYMAFDSKGRMFTTLPSVNEFMVEDGSSLLTGLFVRRDATVTIRSTNTNSVLVMTAKGLIIQEAAGPVEGIAQTIASVRGIPLTTSTMITPSALPSIHAAIQKMGIQTVIGGRPNQSGLAKALFYSRLTDFARSTEDTTPILMGDESGLGVLKRDMDRIVSVSRDFKRISEIPKERLVAEIDQVRAKIKRLRMVLKSLVTAAGKEKLFSTAWINSIRSQQGALESLSKELADIIELDMPPEVQSTIISGEGVPEWDKPDLSKSIVDLLRESQTLSTEKSKEFIFLITALYVDYMTNIEGHTFVPVQMRVEGGELILIRNNYDAFRQRNSGKTLVSVNVLRENGSCDCQAILMCINHTPQARSVAFVANPAAVMVPPEYVDTLIRDKMPGYVLRSRAGPMPTNCSVTQNANVLWPLAVFDREVRNPQQVDQLYMGAGDLQCKILENFAEELSHRSEAEGRIRMADTQIRALQDLIRSCYDDPTHDPVCLAKKDKINPEELENVRESFAIGLYDVVIRKMQSLSMDVSKNDAHSMILKMQQSVHKAPMPSHKMLETLARRERSLRLRKGSYKYGLTNPFAVFN